VALQDSFKIVAIYQLGGEFVCRVSYLLKRSVQLEN
jgi:hypothetical protein